MMTAFSPSVLGSKWQAVWEEQQCFKTHTDFNQKKYYVLEMFPYPSGRIHMGHVRNYALGDVVARFKRAKVLMFFTLWGGMLLACQQKMPL